YLSPDLGPQLSLVGLEKVSINSNNGVSIDTPFSPSIDKTYELSIDEPSREQNQASTCALISIGNLLVSYSRTQALKKNSIDSYPNNLGILYFGLTPHDYLNPTPNKNSRRTLKEFLPSLLTKNNE
ncbi:hypothetical protein IGI04_002120, partial [Brassica rapa subsp. trilocularis]